MIDLTDFFSRFHIGLALMVIAFVLAMFFFFKFPLTKK